MQGHVVSAVVISLSTGQAAVLVRCSDHVPGSGTSFNTKFGWNTVSLNLCQLMPESVESGTEPWVDIPLVGA